MSVPTPDKPKPPNTGPNAGAPCDQTQADCPLHCPKVEIQVNNTPTTSDDLVAVKCLIPAGAATTPCRIRAIGSAPSYTVVLTNPDHRLRFPADADTMKTISLPTDGSWTGFEISGDSGSAALNDAIIEVHCETAAGALLTKKTVTVFWFDDAHMDVTAVGTYDNLGDARFTALGKPAVQLKASARINPLHVDCTAPQIKDLRVGIVQNSFPPNDKEPRSRKVLYGPPEIDWLPGTPAGTRVELPAQWHRTFASSKVTNDSTPAAAPFYALPAKSPAKPPAGCKGGGVTESSDNPGTALHGAIKVSVKDGSGHGIDKEPVTDFFDNKLEIAPVIGLNGKLLGTATYPFQQVFHKEKWINWVVIFNVTTKAFCCLRQRAWTVNLDSNDPKKLQAVADTKDTEPTVAPVTDAPFSNTINDDTANWKTDLVPGATVEKVSP